MLVVVMTSCNTRVLHLCLNLQHSWATTLILEEDRTTSFFYSVIIILVWLSGQLDKEYKPSCPI